MACVLNPIPTLLNPRPIKTLLNTESINLLGPGSDIIGKGLRIHFFFPNARFLGQGLVALRLFPAPRAGVSACACNANDSLPGHGNPRVIGSCVIGTLEHLDVAC